LFFLLSGFAINIHVWTLAYANISDTPPSYNKRRRLQDAAYQSDAKNAKGSKMTRFQLTPVTGKAEQDAFLNVPFEVYRNDLNWVPQLFVERKEHLNPKKNPFFKHAEAQLFVLHDASRPVGRISAQIDQLHLERYKDGTGQFGFLDCINDADAFAQLFKAAEDWLKTRGMTRVQGPFSFSINDESGLLVKGFDTPPSMMMGHSLPYAGSQVEAQGYTKAKDLVAYAFDGSKALPYHLERAAKRAKSNKRISVRTINKKNLKAELKLIMHIFNDAWSHNWGFVPFTEDEINMLGNNLKLLISEGYVAIASLDGEPAAMAITLPNINEWIHDLNGRLFPFGWAKLVCRSMRSRHTSVRLPLMGVLKKYHDSAIGSLLAMSVIETVRSYHFSNGIFRGELSWILEDNYGMRSIIEASGADPYKTYRIYEKQLV
jgi:hypothetical protein